MLNLVGVENEQEPQGKRAFRDVQGKARL